MALPAPGLLLGLAWAELCPRGRGAESTVTRQLCVTLWFPSSPRPRGPALAVGTVPVLWDGHGDTGMAAVRLSWGG